MLSHHRALLSVCGVGYRTLCTEAASTSRAHDLLDRLLVRMEQRGQRLVVPKQQRESATRPIMTLLDANVPDRVVLDLFSVQPSLFQSAISSSSSFSSKLNLLSTHGFKVANTLLILAARPDILNLEDKAINDRLDALRHVGLNVASDVPKEPDVLADVTSEHSLNLLEGVRTFFSANQAAKLFKTHPQVLLHEYEDLADRYEYIYYEMGLNSSDVIMSGSWFTKSLDFIEMRHEFAARTGVFVTPHYKKPMQAVNNPKLDRILDSTDEYFAERVCTVTLEEYEMFHRQWSSRPRRLRLRNTKKK